uniref:Prolyl 4-hydroxylase alpha subunit Fe(2+) 2OG dioxygenase domain-containing protein n=2 Tax=Phaeomonas parva TaxID=124430 RepID=A0A6U4FMG7_9STRA|mmetsp:Transcript_26310/g.81937  ORF Transcript_26310/g.81937 Transcript_26310/m.81937 type:complete len:296 (+) Transcript_26310:541-1428(+)
MQLEYLVRRGRLPEEFREIAALYRYEILKFQARDPAARAFYLDLSFHQNTHFLYGMQVYNPMTTKLGTPGHESALKPQDYPSLEAAYLRGEVLAIDDFLEPWALQELYEYCLEATVFYEVKPNFVGAYFTEGFAHPLLERVALELRRAFPTVVGGLELWYVWSYKYWQGARRGTNAHCDAAVVNFNFWLTPNEANLRPGGGGLRIYKEKPDSRKLKEVNTWSNPNYDLGEYVDVAYRCNRAVMFDSSLLHATGEYDFAPGFENQRINLTFLFGRKRWDDDDEGDANANAGYKAES